jgi:hypothetical protein
VSPFHQRNKRATSGPARESVLRAVVSPEWRRNPDAGAAGRWHQTGVSVLGMKTTLGMYAAFVAISLMLWGGCTAHSTSSSAKSAPAAPVTEAR